MKAAIHATVALALVAAGMYGLKSNIEYSGWVLFVGLLGALLA